jgi:gamma-glutamylcyclotransferase (GGCT)/AIG2-like uncharacterized protein YtfP
MPVKSEIELYQHMRLVELLEALEHVKKGEYRRSVHHFLKAGEPELAFHVYKLGRGKEETIQDMLMESRKIAIRDVGMDWVTPLYGERYRLSKK